MDGPDGFNGGTHGPNEDSHKSKPSTCTEFSPGLLRRKRHLDQYKLHTARLTYTIVSSDIEPLGYT